jgi:hypothetical protein
MFIMIAEYIEQQVEKIIRASFAQQPRQVTVNGSTYTNHTATLKVSVSGVWVYRFTQAQEAALTRHIAGERNLH